MVLGVKDSSANAEDIRNKGSIPRLGRCSVGGAWQLTPVLLTGESMDSGLQSMALQSVRHY